MRKTGQRQNKILRGTLDLLVLRMLVGGDTQGRTIGKVIKQSSEDLLEVEQGSLYPALHRLAERRLVSSLLVGRPNNRKAKFYRLTAEGRNQLVRETSCRLQTTRAIGLVMGQQGGAQ